MACYAQYSALSFCNVCLQQRKKDAAKAKAMIEESSKGRAIRKACEEKKIRMGESVYDGLTGGQKTDPFIDSEVSRKHGVRVGGRS